MMSVKFTVNGQQIRRLTTPYLVKDSRNYIQLDFEFMTKDWAECEKKVIFNDEYEVPLANDSVIVPPSCSTTPEFTVSVYGVNGDVLISTNKVTVQLHEGGYVPELEQTPEKQIETLEAQLAELETMIDESGVFA